MFGESHVYFTSLLKSCKHLSQVKDVHSRLAAVSEHCNNLALTNLLMKMYGKCGSIEDALLVFQGIAEPNQYSWNIVLSAYALNGDLHGAKKLFDYMAHRDSVTWNSLLSAYAHNECYSETQDVFSRIPHHTLVSWTLGIIGCAQRGQLQQAEELFFAMPERDVICWTTMVNAYAQDGQAELAKSFFDRMPLRNLVSWNAMLGAYDQTWHISDVPRFSSPDSVACSPVITSGPRAFSDAWELFTGMPERDVMSWTSGIMAFAHNGHIREARACFDKMPQLDLVSWTAMVSGYCLVGDLENARKTVEAMPDRAMPAYTTLLSTYAQHGRAAESISMFRTMVVEGVQPDRVTLCAIFNACSTSVDYLPFARLVHSEGLCRGDLTVENTLVNMFGKCGDLDAARRLFEAMQERTVVSWTAMLCACAQNSRGDLAILLFKLMDLEGVGVDDVAFTATVDACTSLKALAEGKTVHKAAKEKLGQGSTMVLNALVNMYAKCGELHQARNLFDAMATRGIVTWTTMVTAYAQAGHVEHALDLFRRMKLDGIFPNEVTFLEILHMCSHKGLLQEAWTHFVAMASDYGLKPLLGHYACILDVLGRSGELVGAEDLIKTMPFEPDAVLWTTLLGACMNQGEEAIGSRAGERILKLEAEDRHGSYLLLSNLCSTTTTSQ